MFGRMFAKGSRSAIPAEAIVHPPSDPNEGDDARIDVKALIARFSVAEHIARADAYFAALPDNPLMLRKPFFGIHDTQYTLTGIAEILQRLKLYEGARVLDFGAGTGWLSRIFAFLGCDAVAVDVSSRALEIGRRVFAQDPLAAGLSIDWRVFDGTTLPAADDSIDRIVCFDSFHHVPDQAAILREFYRVLAPGGRVAFREPGPTHSRSDIAQAEMRAFDVIENDIVIEDIWQHAAALGFHSLELALPRLRTTVVTLDRYQRIVTANPSAQDIQDILAPILEAAAGQRIFSMMKGIADDTDSRFRGGLGGRFTVTLTDTEGPTLHGRVEAANTGQAFWRASTPRTGGVWLGVKQGAVEYARISLSPTGIAPGQTVAVDFTLPAPAARPAILTFDLVAEHVAWFAELGSTPLSLTIP